MIRILCFLFCSILMGQTWAACSSYKGLATINEIYERNNGTHFVEVKLLSASLTSTDYNSWTIRACRRTNVCSSALSLSGATRTDAWLVLNNVDDDNIDLNGGMDVILRDGSGNTIDYVTMENYTPQSDNTCTPSYDWEHSDSINNTDNVYRDADGVGNWTSTPGNSSHESERADNSQNLPSGAPQLSVNNVAAEQGTALVFTFTLSATFSSAVSITYQTVNDTALSGTHYTATSGTITIPAGSTSATVSVPTIDSTETNSVRMFMQISSATNASVIGAVGIGTINPEPAMTCFTDDFDRVLLGSSWTTVVRNGPFTPSLAGNRFQLTQALGNQATGATLQKLFPGANNEVVIEFNHYAYGGSGADGVVVVLSDALVTPQPGGYGGSLGYAQLNSTSGFAGGWLGIGIDEYGNFSNNNEGRIGRRPASTGRTLDSVAVRGSGSGTTGYRYVAGTSTLSPGVDASGATPAPGHKYRITLDSTVSGQANLRVERDTTGTGSSYTTLFGPINMLAQTGQAAVPANFFLSLTGSTGGSTNIHSFDNFQVCADQMNDVGVQIDHYELSFATPGLTCEPQDVTVKACLDAACTTTYSSSVTANFTPTGWVGGDAKTFTGGSASFEYQRTTTGTVTLGVSSSNPPLKPLSQTLCRRNGSAASSNCSLSFDDSGLVFDVPNLIANKESDSDPDTDGYQPVKVRAVRDDPDDPDMCVPAFANVTRNVGFYSTYVSPGPTGRPDSRSVLVNGSSVSQNNSSSTPVSLAFDVNGEAEINVTYQDAGQMQLNATYTGSAATSDTGLTMTGNDTFVSRPAGLCVSTTSNCAAGDATCPVFASAGNDFPLTVRAMGWESDADTNYCDNASDTPNYVQANIGLTLTQVAPPPLSPPDEVPISVTPAQHNHVASDDAITTTDVALSEVGVFRLTATPLPYFGETIPAATSANIGRIIPAQFSVTATNGAFANACGTFTYIGQPFTYGSTTVPSLTITAQSAGGATTTQNYTSGAFQKLVPTNVQRTFPAADGDHTAALTTDDTPGADGVTALAVSTSNAPGTFTSANLGVITYSFASGDTFTYEKDANARVAPFTGNLGIVVTDVEDSDGVAAATLPTVIPDATATGQRYGRLRMENAYGPETFDLRVPMRAEFYNGTAFQLNTLDNCTAYDASELILTFDPSALSTSAAGAGSLETGVAPTESLADGADKRIELSAPGADNVGTVALCLNVDDWMKFDWGNTGGLNLALACGNAGDANPKATATFGQYRGHDRIIYWREVEN